MRKKQGKMSYKITIWDDVEPKPASEVKKSSKPKLSKKEMTNQISSVTTNITKRTPKKLKWGFRHAIYAFMFGILLQTVITIPLMVQTAQKLIAEGADITDTAITAGLTSTAFNLFWLQLASYVGWITVALYASYRKGLHSLAKDIWLKFRWVQDISLGILIAVGLRLFEILMFWLFGVLNIDLTGADNSSVFLNTEGPWKYILLFGIVSFAGPISEEILFRGLILQGLLKNFRRRTLTPRTWFGEAIQAASPKVFNAFSAYKEFLNKHKYVLAVIISSTIFGFMHFQGVETFGQWLVVLETGLIGVVLALIALRTKRLGLAIIVHIVFNFSGVMLTLFS